MTILEVYSSLIYHGLSQYHILSMKRNSDSLEIDLTQDLESVKPIKKITLVDGRVRKGFLWRILEAIR